MHLEHVLGESKPIVLICMWTTPSGDSFSNDHPNGTSMPGAGVVHLIRTEPHHLPPGEVEAGGGPVA